MHFYLLLLLCMAEDHEFFVLRTGKARCHDHPRMLLYASHNGNSLRVGRMCVFCQLAASC